MPPTNSHDNQIYIVNAIKELKIDEMISPFDSL